MLNTKLLRCVGPTRASVVFIAPTTHMGARKSTTPRSPDPTRDLREHGAARGYNRRANSESMRWAAEALGFGTSTEREGTGNHADLHEEESIGMRDGHLSRQTDERIIRADSSDAWFLFFRGSGVGKGPSG